MFNRLCLDEVFAISGIIKVKASEMPPQLTLIEKTLIIPYGTRRVCNCCKLSQLATLFVTECAGSICFMEAKGTIFIKILLTVIIKLQNM